MPTTYYVFSGVTSSGTAVNAGDALFVYSGGTTTRATVNSGGFETVSSGGISVSTTISSGGFEAVSAGGIATSTVIKSGGTTFVYSGGVTLRTTISSGAAEIVASAGTASGTLVNPGGYLVVLPGARQSGTTGTVTTSGVVLCQPNAGVSVGQSSTTGTTVSNGGTQYVLTGGTVSNTTVGNSGTQNVFFGGKATSTTVNSGGFEAVSAGGIAIGTTVNDGGYELVTGGTATGTTVNSGGYEFVSSGGRTVSTTVNNGGFQLLSGGTTVSTTLNSGAQQFVLSDGTATGTIVNNGGFAWVFSGGTAVSATLNNGGLLYVSAGGTAIGATVNGGGQAYVDSGGVANFTVVNSGGTETVSSGGVVSGTIINVGGTVDLLALAYSSGGSAVVNAATGILTITEGGTTTRLTLAGNYAHESFLLAADSGGGTQVIALAVPTISGTRGGQQTLGAAQISPFGNVTVADLNIGQTETLTVTLSSAANGTLSNLNGGVYNATTGVYTISGTVPTINAALDGLVFTPSLGRVTPGQSIVTTFTINDVDTAGVSASDSATTVIATVAPAPIISGTEANASVGVRANLIVNGGFEGGVYASTAQPAPFPSPITNTTVPNGWTPAPGFDIAMFNGVVPSNPRTGNNNLQIGNNPADATAGISQQITTVSGIVYQLSFYIANVAYAGTFQVLVDGIQNVTISAQAPSPGGTPNPFIASFADGQVVALDPGPGQYALVTFDFVGTGTDTITLTGTNNNRGYAIDDVAVTALPVLYANQSITPFALVSVTDPNANQSETITVTPSNPANGVLFDPNAAIDGSTFNSRTGVWTVTGSSTAVTADLNALVFRPNGLSGPPGSHLTTWFTISDTDTAGTTVTDSTTSVVVTTATLIRTDNGTSLVQAGVNYCFYDSNGIGPTLRIGGSPVTVGQFGGYAPIVATTLPAGGYEVALQDAGSGLIAVWYTDVNGNFTSGPTGGGVSPTNPALQLLEPSFHQDLNNDGTIGLKPTRVININSGTTLIAVGNEYVLEGSSATGPILQLGGIPVTAGQFGGYAPIVATTLPAGGYAIALQDAASGLIAVWYTDANGNFTSGPTGGGVSPSNPALQLLEPSFHQDLNNDGTIGLKPTRVININSGTTLIAVGNEYVLEGSSATGPILQLGGIPVTAGQFGGYAPIVATTLPAGGYGVALQDAASGLIAVWYTDVNGNFTSGPTGGGVSPSNPALQLLEPSFHQDLNNDGTIGLKPTAVLQIDNGTTLIAVGNEYVMEGSNAAGPILQFGGTPVTAGEFGSWTPIGAVQQNGGNYLVAWSLPGANQYVVWITDSNGSYTGGATGTVSGADFTLEQLESTFKQDLNGNGRLSSVVDTGTSGGDSLILTGQPQIATINLGGNAAFASAGLSAPTLSFIGTPDAITLGAAAATIQYALGGAGGIETIANFSYGLDMLNIDLAGAAPGSLQATNTLVGGQHAIAIGGGSDLTHGVVLLNMAGNYTAANLLSSHTTFSGGHALII